MALIANVFAPVQPDSQEQTTVPISSQGRLERSTVERRHGPSSHETTLLGVCFKLIGRRLSLVGQSQNRTYPCKLSRVEANHNYSWLQSRRPHGLFLLSSRVHACSKPARTVSNPGPPRSCRLGLLARMTATATPIAGGFGSVRQSNPKAIGDVYLPASLPRPPVSTPVFWAMPI